jgi:GNAT superfamily N-acetyltransferase
LIKNRGFISGDYEKIMDFFREIYVQTGKQHCWLPQRWEYAEYNCNPLYMERGWDDWKKYIHIWEEEDKIVAIAHKETKYEVFLQIRPDYEFLANEMINIIENTVPLEKHGNECELNLFINGSKSWIDNILVQRGYIKNDECSYYNVQNLNNVYIPILPDGLHIVDGNDIKDQKSRLLCCHLGFHSDDEPDRLPVKDFYMEYAPTYRADLQLMTQDNKANLCSYCMIWYDEKIKVGMFEPVCTRKDYRMRGIGKAMIIEGLRRLKEIGAEKAYVMSWGDNRRRFYNSTGFITYDTEYPWKKKF